MLAAVLLLSATGLSAQNAPSAHDLAQAIDKHYNPLHTLRTDFTESYEGMGIRKTESGTVALVKPGRMRWDYSNPAGKIFLVDGEYAWFYSRGSAQVQRLPAKKLSDLRSPLRFLLGHTNLEKELSNISIRPADKGLYALSGQLRGQEQRVRRVTLTASLDGTIQIMEIEEIDGALTRFQFSNQQPNANIPALSFRFTPPAGVPIVDGVPPV